jgi:2,4-dienoyl-CoA reductase (NADPH2)
VPEVNTREVPKWMEPADIHAVVEGFGAAAAGAVAAGCDGVEVNAGQHSLVRQFLSGLTSSRTDEWGADRLLFARQVLQAVRAGAGRGAVVGLRLSCDELAPWAGMTPEAAVAVAAELGHLVDAITVVRGSIFTVSATRPDGHVEAGFNLALTRQVRNALPPATVVVAQGSIVDLAMAEAAVADGTCDAVEMTRAQLADPDLVAKAAGRMAAAVRPCILCNQTCMARDVRNPIVTCVVEPSSGHEDEDRPVPPEPASRAGRAAEDLGPGAGPGERETVGVLVVGGGVAGLEAARVAALHGHRVRLVEQADRLGGILRVAARGAGRQRLAAVADWLEHEVRRLEVDVRLGRLVDAEEVADFDGEVVLCTGSRPGRRTYRVEIGAVVLDAAEVLAGALLPPGPLLVWDPIGGPIGISVAERLRADDRTVSLVTPDLIAGNELARSGDLAPANVRLQVAGVVLERRTTLSAVGAGAAHLEDRFTGAPRVVTAAAVVDAGYRLPDDRLWRATGGRLPRAGDAVAPRTAHEAILEGRRCAQSLGAPRAAARAPGVR